MKSKPVIIGMIHLPALPGYPQSPELAGVLESALSDLEIYKQAGVDGVLVENELDRPHRIEATPEVIASMSVVTTEVVRVAGEIEVGVEVLLNDPKASLAIAAASGASFIRTDYFVDRMQREEYGEMKIDPQGLIKYRESISASNVKIMADIQVKYASMIEPKPLSQSAAEAEEAGASVVVVTGKETAIAPDLEFLKEARGGTNLPVVIGSGLTTENAESLLECCDGAIVGTGFKNEQGALDRDKVLQVMDIARQIRA